MLFINISDSNRIVNIIHDSEHPVTTFALLDTGTCLMADSQFDMLMLKMAGIYMPKKALKIESKGPRYEVQDFVIKLGSVSIGPSFRGILVEVSLQNFFKIKIKFYEKLITYIKELS